MIYCCQEHVEVALDMIVDEHETAPVLEKIDREKDLSPACEICKKPAEYMVGN